MELECLLSPQPATVPRDPDRILPYLFSYDQLKYIHGRHMTCSNKLKWSFKKPRVTFWKSRVTATMETTREKCIISHTSPWLLRMDSHVYGLFSVKTTRVLDTRYFTTRFWFRFWPQITESHSDISSSPQQWKKKSDHISHATFQ